MIDSISQERDEKHDHVGVYQKLLLQHTTKRPGSTWRANQALAPTPRAELAPKAFQWIRGLNFTDFRLIKFSHHKSVSYSCSRRTVT